MNIKLNITTAGELIKLAMEKGCEIKRVGEQTLKLGRQNLGNFVFVELRGKGFAEAHTLTKAEFSTLGGLVK